MIRVFGLLSAALFLFCFACLSCQSSIERGRDPARKGYFLAEKMIERGRYYDGLLLHRVNANFFSSYYYGKRSQQRIRELNDKLKQSVKNRPKVEVLRKKIKKHGTDHKISITIVNNTANWVINLRISMQFLDSEGEPLAHSLTKKKKLQRIYNQDIGPWGMVNVTFNVSDYRGVQKVQAKVVDYTLKEEALE